MSDRIEQTVEEIGPYIVVQASDKGCDKCGANQLWDVVYKPDDTALSTSYGDREHADDLADELNDAWHKGRAACEAVLRDEPQDLCHLVRGGTLCGIKKGWGSGNVDIEFGVRNTATCVECLRIIALEWLAALSSPLHQAEPAKLPLRLQGDAGSPIWAMDDASDHIGLRLDSGDGGVVWMTYPQAQEVIDALSAIVHPKPAPSGVVEREDVIAKAKDAYYAEAAAPVEFSAIDTRGMTAAARVILEAALEPTTFDELRGDEYTMRYQCPINVFLEKRLSRLLAHPQADRAERVTVSSSIFPAHGEVSVLLDGEPIPDVSFTNIKDAERYARGLRAELADASAGEKRGAE